MTAFTCKGLFQLVVVALLSTPEVGSATLEASYDILFMLPLSSKSHQNALDPVAEELARRGHQVTMMSPNRVTKVRAICDVHLPLAQAAIDQNLETFNFFQSLPTEQGFLQEVLLLTKNVANATYREAEVMRLLQHSTGTSGYDVMVINGNFNEFVLPMAYHLGLPTVLITPAKKYPYHSWRLNIPQPYSYVPLGIETIKGPMTFLQRAKNVVLSVAILFLRDYTFLKTLDAVVQEFLPGSPAIAELERHVSFLMSNTHTSIHPSIPSMPYYAEVGCLHCVQSKPLPEELDDFAKSSGADGMIYFSIGTVTRGDNMPQEMRDKIIEAFGQLRQKVLWKYESDIEGLPKNIKLVKWAPQQDILGHNRTRLFITHGGGLSTMEAVYHKCPILALPLSADQLDNVANAVHQGFAESLDWKQFTAEEFLAKIRLMLDDRRYQDRIGQLSDLLRDRPKPPAETAAYWIEYVARHKGAHHLKSAAESLNFSQYYLLDVIGALMALIAVTVTGTGFALWLLCRAVLRRGSLSTTRGRSSKKSFKKKKMK